MAHRNLWLIDMGDGTWAVCCMACRLRPVPRPQARRRPGARQPPLRTRPPPQPTPPTPIGLAAAHRAPVGGASPDPPWTDAPPTANTHS